MSAGCSSSVGTSSSIGFSTISWLSNSESSSVDIGSSLIACCNDGVRISFWTSLVCSFCEIPMTPAAQSRTIDTRILVQPEVCPEIDPSHILVRGQGRRCAAAKDGSVVHDVRTIRDAKCFPHIVVGDEHADPSRFQVPHNLLNIGHCDRIDTRKRLIEQYEPR